MNTSPARLTKAGAFCAAAALTLATPSAQAVSEPNEPLTRPDGTVELPLDPQEQEKDQWCWIAAGTAVAHYHGHDESQNELCNRAQWRYPHSDCPNEPGSFNMIARAYRGIGLSSGFSTSRPLSMYSIKREVNENRPAIARIGWRSGGGHMLVVMGYNDDHDTMTYMDPWPESTRINVADHDYFMRNNRSTWTHSMYYIGAW